MAEALLSVSGCLQVRKKKLGRWKRRFLVLEDTQLVVQKKEGGKVIKTLQVTSDPSETYIVDGDEGGEEEESVGESPAKGKKKKKKDKKKSKFPFRVCFGGSTLRLRAHNVAAKDAWLEMFGSSIRMAIERGIPSATAASRDDAGPSGPLTDSSDSDDTTFYGGGSDDGTVEPEAELPRARKGFRNPLSRIRTGSSPAAVQKLKAQNRDLEDALARASTEISVLRESLAVAEEERDLLAEGLQTRAQEFERTLEAYTRRMDELVAELHGRDAELERLRAAVVPPVWVSNKNRATCQLCTAAFSTTRRRHHCRVCGEIFCGSCSSNRIPLLRNKNKTVRACDRCFLTCKEYS